MLKPKFINFNLKLLKNIADSLLNLIKILNHSKYLSQQFNFIHFIILNFAFIAEHIIINFNNHIKSLKILVLINIAIQQGFINLIYHKLKHLVACKYNRLNKVFVITIKHKNFILMLS